MRGLDKQRTSAERQFRSFLRISFGFTIYVFMKRLLDQYNDSWILDNFDSDINFHVCVIVVQCV